VKKRFIIICILSFLTLCICALRAEAIMKGLSTEELARASDIVVMGEIESVDPMWSNDGTAIVTRASLVIAEVIRGKASQQRIAIEYEGGEIGDVGMKVSDSALLIKGERVLLFLKPDKNRKDGKVHRIVGKGQGRYTIGEDGIARKKGFALLYGGEAVDNGISVDRLIEKIKSVR
jgi:hypothetical protein